MGPSYRFSARELNSSTGPEHPDDASFIKLNVGPQSEAAHRPRKHDLSKLIVAIASGVAAFTVAVVGAAAGMAGQLVKAAVSTLFVGLLAVVLVIVAVAAILLLSGCGQPAGPGETGGPGQDVTATGTSSPTATAIAPTATTALQTASPSPTTAAAPTAESTAGPEFEIVTLLPPDAIPAISDPSFVSAEEADDQYEQDELVLGVEIDGDARAYSIPLLSRHEIVNDVVGGKPIAVTW